MAQVNARIATADHDRQGQATHRRYKLRTVGLDELRWQGTLCFKVNKPGIQADRILCKLLAHSPFWDPSSVHCP